MKVKTSELTGAALDWAVAKAEGMVLGKLAPGAGSIWFKTGLWTRPGPGGAQQPYCLHNEYLEWARKCDGGVLGPYTKVWQPSMNWAQGGPIIQREQISVTYLNSTDYLWVAVIYLPVPPPYDTAQQSFHGDGATSLQAAMRCYVASKLGDEVDIPEELML